MKHVDTQLCTDVLKRSTGPPVSWRVEEVAFQTGACEGMNAESHWQGSGFIATISPRLPF